MNAITLKGNTYTRQINELKPLKVSKSKSLKDLEQKLKEAGFSCTTTSGQTQFVLSIDKTKDSTSVYWDQVLLKMRIQANFIGIGLNTEIEFREVDVQDQSSQKKQALQKLLSELKPLVNQYHQLAQDCGFVDQHQHIKNISGLSAAHLPLPTPISSEKPLHFRVHQEPCLIFLGKDDRMTVSPNTLPEKEEYPIKAIENPKGVLKSVVPPPVIENSKRIESIVFSIPSPQAHAPSVPITVKYFSQEDILVAEYKDPVSKKMNVAAIKMGPNGYWKISWELEGQVSSVFDYDSERQWLLRGVSQVLASSQDPKHLEFKKSKLNALKIVSEIGQLKSLNSPSEQPVKIPNMITSDTTEVELPDR